MKTLSVVPRALLLFTFIMTLICTSFAANSAFAQACPGKAEAIASSSDCAACRTDLDNDGKTTTPDLLVLQKCLQETGGCQNAAYDVNGDGVVNQDDAMILRACIMKSLTN